MKLHILAVGQVRKGPEREMVDDYLGRLQKTGRGLGIRDVLEHEVASGGGMDAEAERLLARVPQGARIVLLDERGQQSPSRDLARLIERQRDDGLGDLCFLIGGAEGHGARAHKAAQLKLGFGPQTWPHKLVRVMLAEQLYRAATLLAGTPYHKD
ncbi:MAG: 23S rRNA (pseudouridine(1915)-N(3))-methyltransferase RlmH [Pseudomonadota bacterium]